MGNVESLARKIEDGTRLGEPLARPRVAMVVPSLEILGGHGVQAELLLEGFRKEGYEAGLIPTNPRLPFGLKWLRRLPYIRTLANQLFYLPSLLRLRHVDVVHVFSASYWSFLLAPVPAMLAARLFKRRVILNYHSGEAEDHLAHWGVLVHPWLSLADEIVVPSEYLKCVFARFGYRARVIPNVVDTSRFRYRDRRSLRPTLLSNRNLDPYYRVDNTLKAFALVKARYPEATLTVAGYGSEERKLRRLARELGTDGIRFVGKVDPSAMPALFDEANIFVNSSVLDNQPISLLEAFAAGLPVVSTGVGDIRSMVRDGEKGLIVPEEDPQAMAKAIASLLDNPDRAVSMARRARKEVEKYGWPQVRQEWMAVYSGGTA